MMNDLIQKIWERGKKMEVKTGTLQLENLVSKGIRRFSFNLAFFVWMYLAALGVTLALEMVNLGGYRANPVMTAVHWGIIALAVLFSAYGIHLLQQLRFLRNMDAGTSALIEKRLTFYRTKYEAWMVMISLVVIMLSFAINAKVDNMNGIYRINKPAVFIGTMIASFTFCYGALKISFYPMVREMKALLSDLESQMLDQAPKLGELKKRYRLFLAIGIILAVIFLLFGIWMAMRYR